VWQQLISVINQSPPNFCCRIYLFYRPEPWAGDCWGGGGAEAAVRHLGQHGQRGVQDGQLRRHGAHPGTMFLSKLEVIYTNRRA
jgi:hypothetical protein